MLGLSLHHEKATILKGERDDFLGGAMFEAERALSSKTHRGDDGIASECFLIVTVPAHSLGPVMVKIEQAGVERLTNELFDPLTDAQ